MSYKQLSVTTPIVALLVTLLFSVGLFAQTTQATVAPDACNAEFSYTKSDDYNDSRVNINFESNDNQIDVSADPGYVVTKVELQVQDDGHPGFWQYATGPVNNFNPNPGSKIEVAKVTVKKVCPDVCPNLDGDQYTVPEGLILSDGQCVPPPPTLCEDPLANNQNQPLPCTYTMCQYNEQILASDPLCVPPPPTCSDGIQNQDETGVDTGGICTPPPTLCEDPLANNQNQPLPCTYTMCQYNEQILASDPLCVPPPVYGCMDPLATNYNPSATADDQSCTYKPTETRITIHTQKIVCDEESDLPNWGAGASDITSTTASDWMYNEGENKGCELVEWDFQWVDNADDSTNPGDETEVALGAWSEPFSGSVTIDPTGMSKIWLREVFDEDYIGFTGATTTANVSAEFYCNDDVLHYDNWEWIVPGQDGWKSDYYCVAWNVALERPEPNFCEGNLIADGGFENPEVTLAQKWELFQSQPLSWFVDWMTPSNDTPVFELQELVNGWLPYEGDQYIELDSDRPDLNANTKIWQNIATDDETEYKLTFAFSPRPGRNAADNTIEVWWDGALVGTTTADGTANTNTVWTTHTYTDLPGDGSSTLEFRSVGTSNEHGAFVDAVCLTEEEKETCSLDIVSDDTNTVVENAFAFAVENGSPDPAWTGSVPGATWIWDTANGSGVYVRTFQKTFFWDNTPIASAILDISTDNGHKVWVNGDLVGADPDEFNYTLAGQDQYNVASYIDVGINTLKVEVDNWGGPGGALYKLSILGYDEGEVCEPEVYECSDGVDNDKDGDTDFPNDKGCEGPDDDDEYDPKEPDYGPYCGDGEVNQAWEACDGDAWPQGDTLAAVVDSPSCNQYCQPTDSNQCTDLVLARIDIDDVQNWNPEGSGTPADMTDDIWIGGDDEGTNNVPNGTWFAVWDGAAITDIANLDSFEDVEGLAVRREDGVVRVRMHGSHSGGEEDEDEGQAKEHADGTIEIKHIYSGDSVLTDLTNQLGQNKLENPFNETKNYNAGNDELDELGEGELADGFGAFWMTVTGADDGFNAHYTIPEGGFCDNSVTICKYEIGEQEGLPGWTVMLLGDFVENVVVPSNGTEAFSSVLGSGNPYALIANGTYVYRPGAEGDISDAAFTKRSYSGDPIDPTGHPYEPWVDVNLLPSGVEGYLGIAVDGNIAGTNWSTVFNSAHEYALGYTGTGAAAGFKIWDDNYGDNSGSLDVDIYEGYVGVTGENGCVTFEDVALGEYSVEEIMQDGWHFFSGPKGLQNIDSERGTYTFNLFNEQDEEGDECLIEGYKYDEEGNPLSGWTIGLAKTPNNEFAQSVVNDPYTNIGSDETDEYGYYCVEGEAEEEDVNYYAYEVLKEGWGYVKAIIDQDENIYPVPHFLNGKVYVGGISNPPSNRVDFYNTNEGSITIDKVVSGEGAEEYQELDFYFDLSWIEEDATDLALSGADAPETYDGLTSGSYTIEELTDNEDDWYVTDVDCGEDVEFSHDAGEGDVEVILEPGQDVTCVFTNTYRPGDGDGGDDEDEHIIVRKEVTEGSETNFSFEFDPSWAENFLLMPGQQHDSGDLAEDTLYSVTESDLPDGWELDNVYCYSSEPQIYTILEEVPVYTIDPSEIYLEDGETVTCVFTNDQESGGGDDDDDDDSTSGGGGGSRVRGSSTSKSSDEGEVLGEQISVIPVGAPNTGFGGAAAETTGAAAALMSLLGGLSLFVTRRRS